MDLVWWSTFDSRLAELELDLRLRKAEGGDCIPIVNLIRIDLDLKLPGDVRALMLYCALYQAQARRIQEEV